MRLHSFRERPNLLAARKQHSEAHELHNKRGNEMVKRIILFAFAVAAMALFGLSVHAQNYYGNDPFWNNYYAGLNNTGTLSHKHVNSARIKS
jgi:hypothetical protein